MAVNPHGLRRGESAMAHRTLIALTLVASVVVGASAASAQAPYGLPITLDQAKKAMAGAEAEARKNNWNVVIAIVDSGGNLVMLERMDNTQFGSIDVAKSKAYTAVSFRRPTKVWQDLIGQGGANLRLLKLEGASVLEGGIPIVVNGQIVGGVGVSGGTSQQDAQIAQAGIDALK